MRDQSLRAAALACTAIAALSVSTVAYGAPGETAQATDNGLEEIIVTAQHRSENLQEVPIAVSAVTANALRESGVDTSRDLPQIVPSVQFSRSGASGFFFVRGVGTTNGSSGEESANAVYVDGVYMADLGQTINNFNNIERIEVLKGPQGTLFGRNATGGLIHIITREPGNDLELDGRIGFANYDTINAQVYATGPITNTLSMDVALTKLYQGKGWGRNLTLDRKNKIQDYQGARSKLMLRPSDAVKLTLAGDYYEGEDNLALGYRISPGTVNAGGATSPSGWNTTLNDYPLTKQRIWGLSLTGEADLGFATLTSISAFRKSRNASDFDVDGGPAPLLRITFVSGTKSFQQEVRLASDDTRPLAWQLGVFYLYSDADNDSHFTGAAFPATLREQHILGRLKSDSYAAFGELTYAITPTTKLTGGIRYTKDKRHFVASQGNVLAATGEEIRSGTVTIPSGQPLFAPGVQDSRLSYGKVTWRVALRQDITDDVSVYASANRGFKSGSYSLQNPLNDPYLPQYITAYEIGLKSELFDRKLRFNISGFHYDISDYQVRSAATSNPGSSLVLNAATVKVDGVEMEFEAAPTDGLRLFGGATWLNSRFDKFGGPGAEFQAPITYANANSSADPLQRTRCLVPASDGSANPGQIGTGPLTGGFTTCFGDVSGNKTPNAPKLAASLGASYTVPVGETGELRFTGLYSYNDGYYFESDNVQKQGSYSLVNASVEYRPSENLGVEIWGRNLGNKQYAVQKISSSGLSVVEGLGAPRTYGVNLNFNF
ncbi:TonB-dependent receptor [Novosphingobium album (ex Liu et al. 2023)]|uniref:TonB-dependent receptor n=1 Tax=Novosphingobium album (ex Liu et al. 2023) TaxID=3031130 RepID=A0ABT5WLH7_9SPHN|nr:TonB-dependent receptor [Novosphingobium album (ex Liu et al. 2023)]MDE8650885.1 TonB-dependent receptor [Novosphingobium album (ex Liu et al. 2023)]